MRPFDLTNYVLSGEAGSRWAPVPCAALRLPEAERYTGAKIVRSFG